MIKYDNFFQKLAVTWKFLSLIEFHNCFLGFDNLISAKTYEKLLKMACQVDLFYEVVRFH